MRRLPDRGEDEVPLHAVLGPSDRPRAAAPARVRLAELHPDALEARDPPVLPPEDADGGDEEVHPNPLVLRLHDLRAVGRHLRPGAPVEETDLVRAEAQGGPGAVDRRVPASHDEDAAVQLDLPPEPEASEEVDPGEDAGGVLVRHAHPRAFPGAEAEEDRVEPSLAEARDREVAAEADVRREPHSEVEDPADLEVQDVPRQAVLGDAVPEHSSGLRLRLEQLDRVAAAGEVEGARQPRGTRPDDGHLPAVRGGDLGAPRGLAREVEVGDEPLHRVDRDGLVEEPPAAPGHLARAGADPPADRRERVALLDDREGVAVPAQRRQGDVALDVDAGRAGQLAGPDAVGEVVREEELQGRLPRPPDLGVRRLDLHPLGDLRGAGGDERARPLHLHDAEEAGGEGLEPAVVAERGDRADAVGPGDLEDRHPVLGDDAPAVDLELDEFHLATSS